MELFKDSKVNNEIDAYLLGFLHADGSISCRQKNTYYAVSICLSSRDKEFLNELNKFFEGVISEQTRRLSGYDKEYFSSTLTKCSVKLVQTLIDLGVIPNKTKHSGSPHKNVPEHLAHHFIRGFFDGDGTVYMSSKSKVCQTGFIGTDKDLLTYIHQLLQNVVKSKSDVKTYERGIYRLFFRGNLNCSKIKNFLYKDATIFLKRKRDVFDQITNKKEKHGVQGLSFNPSRKTKKKWAVFPKIGNKKIWGGLCLTKEEACARLEEIIKQNT